MKKNLFRQIILSLTTFLLVAGCAALEVKEDQDESSNKNTSEYLLADVEEIKATTIKYPEKIHLEFDGQEWTTNDLTAVDQEAVNEFLTEILTLSGEPTEKINDKELDDSSQKLVIEFIDGENNKTELTIYEVQETLYGQVDSGKKIYVLPEISDEIYYFQSYLLNESIPTAVKDISEIRIKNNEIKENEEMILNHSTSMNEMERSPFISGWYLHGIYETEFSIEYRVMEEILDTLYHLKGLPIEGISSLEEYDHVISISDHTETDTLYIDSESSQEDILRVLVESTHTVYEVPSYLMNTFSFSPLEIVDNFVAVIPLDAVQEIIIEEKGQETIKIEAMHDLAKGEENVEMTSSFFVNDEEVEENLFRKAYQYLISLSYEQELTEDLLDSQNQEDTIKIIYHYKSEGERVQTEILFHPSKDKNKYVVTKDGLTEFVVNRQDIDDALDQLQHF